jgi:hypothetical protein
MRSQLHDGHIGWETASLYSTAFLMATSITGSQSHRLLHLGSIKSTVYFVDVKEEPIASMQLPLSLWPPRACVSKGSHYRRNLL